MTVERLPNYKSGRTYYRCICDCGNEKTASLSNLTCGHTRSCGCLRVPNRRKDRVGEKYGMLTVVEMLYGYKQKQTYCRCKCDCGNETIAYAGNIFRGATKSCGCLESASRYGRQNHEKDLHGMRFGHLTVVEKTEKRASNCGVIWRCLCDCGNYVEVKSSNLMKGKTRSCGCNKTSKYEEFVQLYLDEMKIEYDREHKFSDCRNVFMLPFDFYIPEYNLCIECQGQQHYHPVEFFGGEERFQTVVENDKIKYDYCLDHNIKLLRLPYTLKEDEIKSEIHNILFPCND